MPRFRALMSTCALTALLASAAPALAANTTVSVGNDKTLSPNSGSVTVAPLDSVTWSWVGPDTDHIITSLAGQA